jgi:hypothetical protein
VTSKKVQKKRFNHIFFLARISPTAIVKGYCRRNCANRMGHRSPKSLCSAGISRYNRSIAPRLGKQHQGKGVSQMMFVRWCVLVLVLGFAMPVMVGCGGSGGSGGGGLTADPNPPEAGSIDPRAIMNEEAAQGGGATAPKGQ